MLQLFFLTYFDIVTSITSNLFFIHLSYTNIEDLHWDISKHWCYCPIHMNNRIKSVCQNVYCCLHLKFFSIYFRNHKETKLSLSGIQTMQTMFMLTLNETCRVNSYFQPLIYSFSLKNRDFFKQNICRQRTNTLFLQRCSENLNNHKKPYIWDQAYPLFTDSPTTDRQIFQHESHTRNIMLLRQFWSWGLFCDERIFIIKHFWITN